nr:hypothetical protein [uncultured Mediterranean phage uvMED]BAR26665.1 hypothetical protein [uncultured Mediterranean phage uvMED]BAR26786.1 hypothetical protein [uncultured Mediterranean phage uvMED]
MAILRTSKTILAAKKETTYGTAVSFAATDCFLVTDVSLNSVATEPKERPNIRGFAGNFPTIPSNTKSELSFSIELTPSGTAGTKPAYDELLLGAGMVRTDVSSTSNTYAPDSTLDDADSLTIGVYIDGSLHRITGARGTFSISLNTSEIPMLNMSYIGIYEDPTATALIAPNYGGQIAPIAANSGNTTAFQLHSYAGALSSFNYDHNNALYYSELISGSKSTRITDRKPSGSCTMESVALGTKNYYTIVNSSATGNLTWQHGQSAGNKITFTAPYVDLQSILPEDNEGYQMLNIAYRALPSSGNDEMSLKFH